LLTGFFAARDGYAADPEHIYLTSGASNGVSSIMTLLISDPSVGILIPIPQYPLYTATLTLQDAHACPYYLNEQDGWSTSISDIRKSLHEARGKGIDVRAIVIINPGNPTGSCLLEEHIQDIVKLAHEESLVLLADEVYQSNIFLPRERPFTSFRKVLKSMGAPYSDSVELVSFHSTSKGQIGECGRRGGYFEVVNLDPAVEAELYKLVSISLCGPVSGQIAVNVMVDPPREGDPSYGLWEQEVTGIHESLRGRSDKLLRAFRKLEGVDCQDAHVRPTLEPRQHADCWVGRNVSFPYHQPSRKSRRGGEGGRQAGRCLLLHGAAQSYRHLHCAWVWLWTAGRIAPLPDHLPRPANRRVLRANYKVSSRVHGSVSIVEISSIVSAMPFTSASRRPAKPKQILKILQPLLVAVANG
jgi:aspartate/methionine/tyrosine aminotransferase